MGKKRERLEIIRDILEAVKEKRSIKPTRLLYSSNLSPQMFKSYIGELTKKGFIEEKEKKKSKEFVLTNKGRNFLYEYKKIENFIESFGL